MSQKSENNIWKDFAKETDGIFKEGYSWISDSTEIEYKKWKIIFDNFTIWSGKYSAETTRIITPIILIDNFRFEIYREGFTRKIEKLFGAQDLKIDDNQFDKSFIIKSNNKFKIKKLLQNKELKNQLELQKEVNLQISDQKGIWGEKLPKDQFELSFFLNRKVRDLELLKAILKLFKIILDDLHEMKAIE
ncbi:hypothetical protein SGQ44_04715 [Flavobacterium sp. Fl-77]|uniref:DUF3137 domain-containing protein n=1 Tax=Flavobacterium flavipigmentatum TaxID=2893884 RepID=A0AAJ2S5T2_9FLAO|nr:MULTISPECIES: hypothetical protein [unclassified Flavobacterium]MDX6181923.1 hypothetical protein [Flavobacterium sp. Fl-33]MDX6185043.1 hypothetical protein [Flavobacterium sp. Fl-77]UFH37153.1 hypothetical protein LNP22_10445 [Flavobacterium sp. F-70]